MNQFLSQFRSEMYDSGCLDVPGLPGPTLANSISPMYAIHRWAGGYGQRTKTIYRNMGPSLQAASLMVTEMCTLAFYTHLTYGRPTIDPSSGKVYIAASRYEHTSEGRATTLQNVRNLGEMITLMFVPRDYYDGSYYGVTYKHREQVEWIRKFHPNDLPSIPDTYRESTRGKIVVALSPDFQDFFLHSSHTASMALRYRMWMLFTSTLAHETAHAYEYFLNRGSGREEPLWSRHDKESELGFAWETTTLGRIINPIFSDIKNCRALTSYQSEKYTRTADRLSIIEKVIGRVRRDEWRRVNDSNGRAVQMTPSGVRGGSWFDHTGGRPHGSISVIHAVPMWWIVTWFSEEEWEKKRSIWRNHLTYAPTSLGSTFILLHEQGLDGNTCLRIPQTSHTEFDPYLSTVRAQAQAMRLYDDNYSGDYDDDRGRSHSRRSSSRPGRAHSRPGRTHPRPGRDRSSSSDFILEGIPADFWEPVILATLHGAGRGRPDRDDDRGRSYIGRNPSGRSRDRSTSLVFDMGAIPDDSWEPVPPRSRSGGRSSHKNSRSGHVARSPPFGAFGGQGLAIDDFVLDNDYDYLGGFDADADGFPRFGSGFGSFGRR
jgi:hypothetical protein